MLSIRTFKLACIPVAAAAVMAGCAFEQGSANRMAECRTASCYLGNVSAAQWAQAAAKPVVVAFDKVDNSGGPSDYTYMSEQWTDPAKKTLVFEAGKPYVLKFINRFSALNNTAGGDAEHYFTSPEFYRSVVVEKIVTPTATYRAPLLNDFELNAPAHNSNRDTEALIYFIPVKTGVFTAVCKEGKHSDPSKREGMVATLQIVGRDKMELDFDMPADFSAELGKASHPLKGINYASGPKNEGFWHEVTLDAAGRKVDMSPLQLRANQNMPGYMGSVVRLKKTGEQSGAVQMQTGFFKTMALRKIHDQHAQIKPFLLHSIEFAPGASQTNPVSASKPGKGEIDLFMVPTVPGQFDMAFRRGTELAGTAQMMVR